MTPSTPYPDGHDALIDSLEVDFAARTVRLRVQVYPEPIHAAERMTMTLDFSGVASFVSTADLRELAENASAGHVNHWHLAEGPGASHIYLVEGYITVTAEAAPALAPAI
ncbi:hypothetical protein [Caulobacter endophyticus]|uniref:Uncharacterized protein n=1 Tax=Caulobacter endophyticus TaxID=2172652 RepID=A0A2T9KBH0_9CAUL|nr:hypothetical protein [Caulobacter endophyticus]PVM93325.1 hypothetical protein DDF67_03665 [Caulobacter endophyticus]